jgi:type IV pilus assembly protein PilB
MARKRIGDILRESGAIDNSRLAGALRAQSEFGGKLGELMVDYGFIADHVLARALAIQYRIPVSTGLIAMCVPRAVVSLVKASTAEAFGAIPIATRGGTLLVAMQDPADRKALAALSRDSGYRIYPLVASRAEIMQAYNYYYQGMDTTAVERQSRSSTVIVRNNDVETWASEIYSRG